MPTLAGLQPIEHAHWCPRTHPETEDGQSYLVLEKHWTTGLFPYLDATMSADLLRALHLAAEHGGVELYREQSPDGPRMRLCAAWRLLEVQREIDAVLSALPWDDMRQEFIQQAC